MFCAYIQSQWDAKLRHWLSLYLKKFFFCVPQKNVIQVWATFKMVSFNRFLDLFSKVYLGLRTNCRKLKYTGVRSAFQNPNNVCTIICNNSPFTCLLVEMLSAFTKVNITVYLSSIWVRRKSTQLVLYCNSHVWYFWLLLQIMRDINMLFQTAFVLSFTDISFDADNK